MIPTIKYVDVRVVIGFSCGCQCALVFDLAGRVQDQDREWRKVCGASDTHDIDAMYKDAATLAQQEANRDLPSRGAWR